MAWQYVTSDWSSTWTPSGSSLQRKVAARLYYQVTQTPTTYTIEIYGQECLYNDNVGVTINGRLNLTGNSEVTGSHSYTYTSGGTNHQDVYNTICGSAASPLRYALAKTKSTQSISGSMKAYRNNFESTIYATVSLPTSVAIVPTIDRYTISYNANGGTGSIPSQQQWYGESTTLNGGSGFVKTNYKVAGWNTKANGTGTHYALGATISATSNLTLYAEWELNCITLKCKVNGSWKSGVIQTKVSGTWKLPFIGYVKVNGTWKQIT